VQDVFADVWVYRQSLNHPINVKAYLLSSLRKRIARILERDRIFGKSASVDIIEFLPEFSIEHELIADEVTAVKVSKLNVLLNLLPTRQKEALYLKYHHGLDIDEIADALEVNYQSVSNLLYRAVLNLRKEWNEKIMLIIILFTTGF
jgi:RNA polymerase sigma factor (sigma-70 family)